MRIFNIIITTKKEQDYLLCESRRQGMRVASGIDNRTAWAAIISVISSLKELRKNTWDVERVDQAINWLKNNFEMENKS